MASETIIWPLFVYFAFAGSSSYVGIASSLAGIGTMIFAVIVGRLSDLKSKTWLIKIGALLSSIIWALRFSFGWKESIFPLSLLGSLFFMMIEVPFFGKVSEKALKENITDFITFRESSIGIGRVLAFLLFFLAIKDFELIFLIASLLSLVFVI